MRTNFKRLICGVCVCALVISCVPMTGCGERKAAKWAHGKILEEDVTNVIENTRAYYGYDDDLESWTTYIEEYEYDDSDEWVRDEDVYYEYDEDTDEYTPVHGHILADEIQEAKESGDEDGEEIEVYKLKADGTYKSLIYDEPSSDDQLWTDRNIYYLEGEDGEYVAAHGYNIEEGTTVYDLVDGEYEEMTYEAPDAEELTTTRSDREDAEEEWKDAIDAERYEDEYVDGEVIEEDEEDDEDDTYTEGISDGKATDYRIWIIIDLIKDDFVDYEIERRGLTVDDETVEEAVESDRAQYEASYMEGMFESIVQSYGYDDLEDYTEMRRDGFLEEELMEQVTGMSEDDEDYDSYEASEIYEDWLEDQFWNGMDVTIKSAPIEMSYDPETLNAEAEEETVYYSYDEDEDEYTEIDSDDLETGDHAYILQEEGGEYVETIYGYDTDDIYYTLDEDSGDYTLVDEDDLSDGDTVYTYNKGTEEYSETTYSDESTQYYQLDDDGDYVEVDEEDLEVGDTVYYQDPDADADDGDSITTDEDGITYVQTTYTGEDPLEDSEEDESADWTVDEDGNIVDGEGNIVN